MKICVICESPITPDYGKKDKKLGLVRCSSTDPDAFMVWDNGNNAQPVANGRCCNDCRDTHVRDARVAIIEQEMIEAGDVTIH
jgi:hypothetical protein